MLKIVIPAGESFDYESGEFVQTKEQSLQLEHSLVSISKWEAKWHKPFLEDSAKKTKEELLDYIRCMTITKDVDPVCYYFITNADINRIKSYIDDTMTATWFGDSKKKYTKKRVVTSELIYCWMVMLQIPFECEKWHLNRLFTLIKVCNEENKPADKNKRSKKEFLSHRAALNAARKKQLNIKD